RRVGDRLLPRLERVAQTSGILPARFGKRRTPTAAASDVATEIAHQLDGVEPAPHERLVEVDHEVGAPVVHRPDDRARGLLLPANAVRQLAELAALERLRLDEEDVPFPVDDREVDCGVGTRLARLLAQRLELDAQLFRLQARAVEERVGLARRDRLDPACAGADGALGEEHERADLSSPAYVRPATELA